MAEPTRTERLMQHLTSVGPASAAVLAKVAGLPNSGRVTALLKTRIDRGQVERCPDSGKWQVCEDWTDQQESEIRDAIMILERYG